MNDRKIRVRLGGVFRRADNGQAIRSREGLQLSSGGFRQQRRQDQESGSAAARYRDQALGAGLREQGHGNRAGAHGAIESEEKLAPVRQSEHHALTGLQPLPEQMDGKAIRAHEQLGE